MNPNKLSRIFKNASKSFIKLNSDRSGDSGSSNQSQQMDGKEVCKTLGGQEMGAQFILRHCEVEFYANHGKQLDQDNKRYIVKPILDALVNIGIACDDSQITSEVTQRMDKDNSTL